jgi:putative oxidoreductase
MLYHGLSKLRGDGPAQVGAMFESLGLKPGRPLAIATGVAEAFIGAAAVLGIATRPAAVATIVTQAVAIWKVHRPKGYSVTQGGMEYNLALIAVAAGFLLGRPRGLSVHGAIDRRRSSGLRWLARRVEPTAMDRALDLLH